MKRHEDHADLSTGEFIAEAIVFILVAIALIALTFMVGGAQQ